MKEISISGISVLLNIFIIQNINLCIWQGITKKSMKKNSAIKNSFKAVQAYEEHGLWF